MTATCAAGIDAGKLYLDVGIEPSRSRFRVDNAPKGIACLIDRLRQAGVHRVVLEAIGPYGQAVIAGLDGAGFAVGMVNPRRIKAFREAEGKRAKTDRLDAGLIARFAVKMSDELRPIPSANQQALKSLATRRRQLVEMIAMEKTRLKQAVDPVLCDSHRSTIAALCEQRALIEGQIAAKLDDETALARRMVILRSLPGVGAAIATTLVVDLPELGSVDRRVIASLAGIAPHPSQSGLSPGRNQISGGRPCVRTALYMAGLVASRCDPRLKAEYQAMRNAGKPAKVAIIAVARKLLVLANAIIKKDCLYDPTHVQTQITH
jgi:transposase